MTPRILVIESDEPSILPLAGRVAADGYRSATLGDDDAVAKFERRRDLDLLLLLWDLPRTSHRELSKLLREQLDVERIPVVVFAYPSRGAEIIRNVPVGVHEHVAEPLPFHEIVGRVNALLSNSQTQRVADVVVAGEIVLDRKSQTVRRGLRTLNLSLAPFRLLDFLMSNPGRVFTRRQLIHSLWSHHDASVDERTIDVDVGRIRGAMNRGNDPDPIRTVRGKGYAFDEAFGFEFENVGASRGVRRRWTPVAKKVARLRQ